MISRRYIMKNSCPIIIVSAGRSGSTVFHRILSEHPDAGWLSTLLDKDPSNFRAHRRLLTLIDRPFIGRLLQQRIIPSEAYNFWDRYCPGFSVPCRDLSANDLSPRSRSTLRNLFPQVLTHKRHRLLLKVTGWPRIGFIKSIFPDAKFIHVVRDPHAFVNSITQTSWWLGWRGPHNWRWGPLSTTEIETWQHHGESFYALGAIQWNRMIAAWDASQDKIDSDDFLEIRYEDLCRDQIGVYKKVADFAEMEFCAKFKTTVMAHRITDSNVKFERDLSPAQVRTVSDVCSANLARYGYSRR